MDETLEQALQRLWLRKVKEYVSEVGELQRTWAEMPTEAKAELLEKENVSRGLPEDTFNVLKYVDEAGVRLGDFQTAYKSQNMPDKWLHCWNILKANNAVISNPFHEEGYLYRYWIFPEKYTDRIFRKKLKEAEPVSTLERITGLFPEDLRSLLAFEEQADAVIIKPRQFLGAENFARIASIVKEHGGEYISAGKESHFRIPKIKGESHGFPDGK